MEFQWNRNECAKGRSDGNESHRKKHFAAFRLCPFQSTANPSRNASKSSCEWRLFTCCECDWCGWFAAFAVNFSQDKKPWKRSRLPFTVEMRLLRLWAGIDSLETASSTSWQFRWPNWQGQKHRSRTSWFRLNFPAVRYLKCHCPTFSIALLIYYSRS